MKNLKEKLMTAIKTTPGKIAIFAGSAVAILLVSIIFVILFSSGKEDENNEIPSGSTHITDNETEIDDTDTELPTVSGDEEETTTSEETTTAKKKKKKKKSEKETETTTIEIIKMEDLNIAEEETVPREQESQNKAGFTSNEELATEPDTEAATDPVVNSNNSNNNKPTKEQTTKKEEETTKKKTDVVAPKPAVNEYACLVYGIDVSAWQGEIDWAKVKQAGYNFVIIRCGGRNCSQSGTLFEDIKFKQNIEGALANGIQVGVYFFSQALTEKEAQEEASLVINMLKGYKITYPVVYDWETADGYRTYNKLTSAQLVKIAKKFMNMVKQAGYEPMYYGGDYNPLYSATINEIAKSYKVWYASWPDKYQTTAKSYVAGEATPSRDFAYQMWQYKSTGSVPGINGNVDMDVAFFSYKGSGVPSRAIQLNVKRTEIEMNVGGAKNLLYGVSAKNTAGATVTSDVTYVVTNAAGQIVDERDAFNTAGYYTITYTIKDFTGASVTKSASLIVRSRPTINLKNNEIVYFTKSDSGKVTAKEMVNELQKLVENNIASAKSFEGKDVSKSVTYTYSKPLYLVDAMGNALTSIEQIGSGYLKAGKYTVKYKVTDEKSFANSATANIIIIDLSTTEIKITKAATKAQGFTEELKSIILGTVTQAGRGYVNITYDDALATMMNNNSYSAGSYNVKISIGGQDANKYYRTLTVSILEDETESSSEVTTEENTETATLEETTTYESEITT